MVGKVKILILVLLLAIGGATATMTMDREHRQAERDKAGYAVHLAEVEALYDHEVYVLIRSENGAPVCGAVELLPAKQPIWECCGDREERPDAKAIEDEPKEDDCEKEPLPDEEPEEEERKAPEEEYGEEETSKEEEREPEETEERPEDETGEEPEEGCCREEDELPVDGRDPGDPEECQENWEREEREKPIKRTFRFNFDEGKGRLLLFPSSHRCLGMTAIITVCSRGEVTLTPFIHVKDTDVVIYPDSKDEEGRYCRVERTRGGARYGFEDLMGSPDERPDWDYDDVVLCVGWLPKKEKRCEGDRAYILRVRWGQLEGLNEDHKEMVSWDGSIFVGDGAVVLIEPLYFDKGGRYENGGDDLIYTQVSRNEIQWRASTTVHWDGILVKIIVPEDHKETHVAIHTAQWSGVFDEDRLANLYERFEINELGDEIEINGWKDAKEPPLPEISGEPEEEKER